MVQITDMVTQTFSGSNSPEAPVTVNSTVPTVPQDAPAGTVVGQVTTTGGQGPYVVTVTGNGKFTTDPTPTNDPVPVTRTGDGTLTAGTPETINLTSTDTSTGQTTDTTTNGQGGSVITVTAPGTLSVPLHLTNIGASSAATPFVTYAHPFADGDIAPGGSVTLTDSNSDPVTVQMDGIATWPSGCVKFAVLSHACAETFGAGVSKAYAVGSSGTAPDNTPDSMTWGANAAAWAAKFVSNSDFRVEYSGFDCGANNYEFKLNDILNPSNYSIRNPGYGTSNPTGGWEITKKGKVCVEIHAWGYIKNTSTGFYQGYIRCDMWAKAWDPTGPWELDVRTTSPNIWNAITPTSEKYNLPQGRFAALIQIKNSSTVLKYDGGANDITAVTVPNANFLTATSRLNYTTGSFFPQTAITFSSTGTLPAGLTANTLYWPSYANGADQPFLAVQRYYCSLEEQNGGHPSWTPNTAYNKYDWITNNGAQYQATAAGTSAPSGGPTGPGTNIADGSTLRWTQITTAFTDQGSGTITASPVSMCFPGAGMAHAAGKGDPIWAGSGSRPAIVPGHDFNYLTQLSKFTMAYNAAAGSELSGQVQPDYLPNRQTGGMYWDQSQTGPSLLRIGFMNPWNVASLYQPTDPFYYYGTLQGALCWHQTAYAFMIDEAGGMPLVANNGTNNTGATYAGLPPNIPNWCTFNVPGSVNPGIVSRSAQWSGWLSDDKNNSGTNGQYYGDPSHVPMNAQIAYLKTGRPIFLESAICQANNYHAMVYQGVQTIGGKTYFCLSNGAYGSTQLRGWAWAWRCLFQSFFMTPDDHLWQPVLRDIYNDNLGFEAARITLRYPANQIACGVPECLDHDNAGGKFAPWMLAFFIQVVATEHWRGGQTTAGSAAIATISNFLANFWARYLPSVNALAANFFPVYDEKYALNSQDFLNCYTDMATMFTASAAAGLLPIPWINYLYDHDQGVFHVGFPGNTDSYHVFGQCAVSMHALALPNNAVVTGAKTAIQAAFSAGSGISAATGCVQWHGSGQNIQTHAVF